MLEKNRSVFAVDQRDIEFGSQALLQLSWRCHRTRRDQRVTTLINRIGAVVDAFREPELLGFKDVVRRYSYGQSGHVEHFGHRSRRWVAEALNGIRNLARW